MYSIVFAPKKSTPSTRTAVCPSAAHCGEINPVTGDPLPASKRVAPAQKQILHHPDDLIPLLPQAISPYSHVRKVHACRFKVGIDTVQCSVDYSSVDMSGRAYMCACASLTRSVRSLARRAYY